MRVNPAKKRVLKRKSYIIQLLAGPRQSKKLEFSKYKL